MPEHSDNPNMNTKAGVGGIDPSFADKVDGGGNTALGSALDDLHRSLLGKLTERFFRYLRYLAR